jgi:ribonuclease HII
LLNSKRYKITFDEVGRGAIAGPLTVCAVVYRDSQVQAVLNSFINHKNERIQFRDSKKLSESSRAVISQKVRGSGIKFYITSVPVSYINSNGISAALRLAVLKLIKKTGLGAQSIQRLEFDGDINLHQELPGILQVSEPKFDESNPFCAAASVIAKVHRDKMMEIYSRKHSIYMLNHNKGYGTKQHIDAIKKFGMCRLHRKKFNIKALNPGYSYEDEIEELLRTKYGIDIVSRNFKVKGAGEIDIIGVKDRYIYFIEVKFRSSSENRSIEYTVTAEQQTRTSLTAKLFLEQYPEYNHLESSFPAILIDESNKKIVFNDTKL